MLTAVEKAKIAKRQDMSLRYFMGSELQKTRVMQRIRENYANANHNTTGRTAKSLFPKNDADWVANRKGEPVTYLTRYKIDPTFGVLTDLYVELRMVFKDQESKLAAYVLDRGFTRKKPKAKTEIARERIADWAQVKLAGHRYSVKSKKGKVYHYSVSDRPYAMAVAYRIGHNIDESGRIKNMSGFLKPWRTAKIHNAMNRAINRFNARWIEDVSGTLLNLIDIAP